MAAYPNDESQNPTQQLFPKWLIWDKSDIKALEIGAGDEVIVPGYTFRSFYYRRLRPCTRRKMAEQICRDIRLCRHV